MKKIFKIVLVIMVITIGLLVSQGMNIKKAYAYDVDGISVDIGLSGGQKDGSVKAGDSVTIKLKLNNVTDLYAASFNYTYDPNILQVNSIDVSEEIESSGVYQPYKDTAKDGNRTRFCFTFLGDGNGLSGDYDFVTINGQAKADGKILVGKDNISFELIQRKGDDMVKNDYYFNDTEGNVYKLTNVESSNENKDKSKEDNNESKSAGDNQGKKKSNVSVELVQKANEDTVNEDSTEEKAKNDNSEQVGSMDKDKNEDENNNEEQEKGNSLLEDEKGEEVNNKKAYIIGSLAFAVIILGTITFYKVKEKNN